jgi:hypothetical protein
MWTARVRLSRALYGPLFQSGGRRNFWTRAERIPRRSRTSGMSSLRWATLSPGLAVPRSTSGNAGAEAEAVLSGPLLLMAIGVFFLTPAAATRAPVVKLSAEERDFLRLVFEETGGIPFKYVALTELPVAAEALGSRGFIELRRSGREYMGRSDHGRPLEPHAAGVRVHGGPQSSAGQTHQPAARDVHGCPPIACRVPAACCLLSGSVRTARSGRPTFRARGSWRPRSDFRRDP